MNPELQRIVSRAANKLMRPDVRVEDVIAEAVREAVEWQKINSHTEEEAAKNHDDTR